MSDTLHKMSMDEFRRQQKEVLASWPTGKDVNFQEYTMLILPGGMPGTKNLEACAPLMEQLDNFYHSGKWVAAICAAPSILGHRGYLKGRKATCYPGFESQLEGAQVTHTPADTDGNVITGRGMGCAIPFALSIIEVLKGKAEADKQAESICFR